MKIFYRVLYGARSIRRVVRHISKFSARVGLYLGKRNENFERRHAERVLTEKYMREYTNGHLLSDVQRSEIQQFWKRYDDVDDVFFSYYYDRNGIFSEKYIPDSLWYTLIDHYFDKRDEAMCVDNKCYYSAFFPTVSQPRILLRKVRGIWYDERLIGVNVSDVKEYFSNYVERGGVLFVKPALDSCGGEGIFCITGDNVMEFVNVRLDELECDIVVQKKIEQHEILSKLNPSSVNTIRIMSFIRKDGTVKILSRILRMGRKGSCVDNICSGGMFCGIDERGHLKDVGYDKVGRKHYCHPDSFVKFEGVVIPNWGKVESIVLKSHTTLSRFRLISWDIAIDADGEPVLIEVNLSHGGLGLHQICNGPIFGEETEEVLNEVYGK